MKQILISALSLLLAISACKTGQTLKQDPWMKKLTQNDNLIIEGVGTEDFKIGDSIAAVVAKLGDKYEDTTFRNNITRITYMQYGLIFFYPSSTLKVSTIYMNSPFKGHTEPGIVIDQSTITEVMGKYGVAEWYSSDKDDSWWYEYEKKGIAFHVKRDMTVPQFPLDEKPHEKKVVYRISIKAPK